MPSVHVLVDLENNQPTLDDVRRLVPDLTDAWLFYSPRQRAHLSSFAPLGSRHTPVPLSRPGRNALDFQLAFYAGYIAARNPGAKLVVVAIDNDYAPMIEHANHLGLDVTKVAFKSGTAPRARKAAVKAVVAKKRPAGKKARAESTPAKKTVAKKTPAKQTAAAPKPRATKSPGTRSPATKANGALPVKATPAKKSPRKAAPAKAAAPAKTAPAKAAAPAKTPPAKAALAKTPAKKTAPARGARKATPSAPRPPPANALPRAQLGVDKAIANLRKMGERRPKKLKQLQRHLLSLLGRGATDDGVRSLLAKLLAADALRVSGDAVDYTAAVTEAAYNDSMR